MSDDSKITRGRGDAVLAIFKRGAEFTKQILEENESLRQQLMQLQTRQITAAKDPGDWEELRVELAERVSLLETENKNLLQQLKSVETENQHFAERYLEIEEENNNLANLYVASYQLHSTLDPSEVLKVILEIVINLIGAEIFCVYVFDEGLGVLEPVASEGSPTSTFPRVTLGQGFVGKSVQSGEVESGDIAEPEDGTVGGRKPVVCIPLRVEDRPVGAIVIYSLLQQKDGFSPLAPSRPISP